MARMRPEMVTGPVEAFPDFLIVGPQRTGTTWLYRNLDMHPQVFMPKRKELHFFNLLDKPKHPNFRSDDLEWYLAHFKCRLPCRVQRALTGLLRSRKWYQVKTYGEATASYAPMEPAVIRTIASLNPGIKAVIMVRDPVERAWSHAVKDLVKRPKRRPEEVRTEDWLAYFNDPYQIACSRYSKIVDNWRAALGEGQVFVGRFEDISADPKSLLSDVYEFLGIDTDERLMPHAHTRVNPSGISEVPPEARHYLRNLFAADLQELEARFGWKYE